MKLEHHVSLKPYNSLSVDAIAHSFAEIDHWYELEEVLSAGDHRNCQLLCLGEGSNVLLRKDFSGLVLRIQNRGISIIDEDDDHMVLRVAAGENWHQLVTWAVNHDLWGIENLALIPGSVGAAPVQNIGAYGVEICSSLLSVQVFDRFESKWQRMSTEDCRFSYRDSLFKRDLENRYLITEVCLRLGKSPRPVLDYPGLITRLEADVTDADDRGYFSLEIADAVSAIRREKLPDPTLLPNAGSFFKNPSVSADQYESLKKRHDGIPGFPLEEGQIKLSAGWLIEQAGFKGNRVGDAAVSENHALVMVNHGNASGEQIWQLARQIMAGVYDEFGVKLHVEPRII